MIMIMIDDVDDDHDNDDDDDNGGGGGGGGGGADDRHVTPFHPGRFCRRHALFVVSPPLPSPILRTRGSSSSSSSITVTLFASLWSPPLQQLSAPRRM